MHGGLILFYSYCLDLHKDCEICKAANNLLAFRCVVQKLPRSLRRLWPQAGVCPQRTCPLPGLYSLLVRLSEGPHEMGSHLSWLFVSLQTSGAPFQACSEDQWEFSFFIFLREMETG